jgi:hypothetical protein
MKRPQNSGRIRETSDAIFVTKEREQTMFPETQQRNRGQGNMKKSILLIGSTILLATSAFASDNFTFINETGYTITGLWCSPHNKESWGNQLLDERLPSDSSIDVIIRDNVIWNTDDYDIRVEYYNGVVNNWRAGLNLSGVSRVTATLASDGKTTNYSWE